MWLPLQPVHQVVRETVEVVPELLLGEVLIGATGNADDSRPIPQRFFFARIIGANGAVADKAGDQVDLSYQRVPGQGAGEIDNVLGLAAGIGVPAQFQVVSADETMNTEQADGDAIARVVQNRDSGSSRD
jgi:hypothetical protein